MSSKDYPAIDPKSLGCLFSGNCDFCQDPKCGPTSERMLICDLNAPQVAQGWKICESKECDTKYQINLPLYREMTMKELKVLYPDPVVVVRSNGQVEKDWVIASHLIRYTHKGSLYLTVAMKTSDGNVKVHKIVPLETFRLWQALL